MKYHLVPFKTCKTDLSCDNVPELLLAGYQMTCNLVICEAWEETQFKIIHWAYYPYHANRADAFQSTCSWCTTTQPSLLHRLWNWPMISEFWNKVLAYITQVGKARVPNDPLISLFGHEGLKDPVHSSPAHHPLWAHICLLVTWRTILQAWIHPSPPQLFRYTDCYLNADHTNPWRSLK